MTGSRSGNLRPWGLVLVLLALAGAVCCPGGVLAQDPGETQPEPATEANAASRLDRLLNRFFGHKSPSGQALQGRAVSVADRFSDVAGRTIEVVPIHPVERFERGWDQDKAGARRLVNNLTRSLQSYTDDWVIRDFLLFRRGDLLNPYLLADSERLLRSLSFISDVRIDVVPLDDKAGTVAVVVQTTDRWPVGVDGNIKSEDEYWASSYSVNILGSGLGFSNQIMYNRPGSPATGYKGILNKRNLAGSFWDAEIEYENTHKEHQDRFVLERNLVHPGISAVGGVSRNHLQVRGENVEPSEVVVADAWIGLVHRLYDRRQIRGGARPLLVPALRFVDREYCDRPHVVADSNLTYHENRLYLGGLYFRSLKYYKTSFLLGLGETENVPRGLFVKAVGGYEDGEFRRRTCLFLDAGGVLLRDQGDVAFVNVGWGGYFRNRRIEQGMFKLNGGYYSSLLGAGSYRTRVSGRMGYTLGIRRLPGESISVRPEDGLRVLPNREVEGGQRLTTALETNLFTPWSLIGFRVSCFTFVDAGVIGTEKSASLWQEKVYYGTGFGFNLRNPDLALPTWRVSFAVRNRVEDHGTDIQVTFRSLNPSSLGVPGTKPSLPVYR
jgi:hypothetical protein